MMSEIKQERDSINDIRKNHITAAVILLDSNLDFGCVAGMNKDLQVQKRDYIPKKQYELKQLFEMRNTMHMME